MARDLPSGTVTFLFTDVQGSTRLLRSLGAERYAAALADHRSVIRRAVTAEQGVEVDTQGDAFFVAFRDANRAVRAAQAMIAELASGHVRVRIGLHTGTPLVTDEGYVGEDVHLAARITAAAHGGQVVMSGATAELLGGVSVRELGEHRLKDIDRAVSLFQVGLTRFPPLRTIANTNLPRPVGSFVGREAEVRGIVDDLRGGHRLVTLVGPGGTGKTRLAIEAATTAVGDYPAGTFWIDLAAVRDASLVPLVILQTLGATGDIAQHIGHREMLLVLDNLEQVIESASGIASLLAACPNLAVLATSRERLAIRGEHVVSVPPLPNDAAVMLFCDRAQVPASADVADLCRRLESLPLAVELAASRASALQPREILERLSSRLDLKGGRDADPRQRTMRATIAWSVDLLSAPDQSLFREFAPFAGGATIAAIEEVCEVGLDEIQSLVDKSLLRRVDDRFLMLETIREYAEDRLRDAGGLDAARARHAEWYRSLARQAESAYSEDPRRWGDVLEAERDNLRSALSWALGAGEDVASLDLAAAYGRLAASRGPQGEGRRWLSEALRISGDVDPGARIPALAAAANLAERQNDVPAACAFAEEWLQAARSIDDRMSVGRAMAMLGILDGESGDLGASVARLREALELLRSLGADREVRQTLGMMGFFLLAQGDHEGAITACEEGLALARAARDDRNIAVTASNLASAYHASGRLLEALPLHREALLIMRDLMDVQPVSEIALEIAGIAADQGDHDTAAMILGAIGRLRDTAEFEFVSVEIEDHDRTWALVRASLTPDALSGAVRRGADMTIDELIELCFNKLDSLAGR